MISRHDGWTIQAHGSPLIAMPVAFATIDWCGGSARFVRSPWHSIPANTPRNRRRCRPIPDHRPQGKTDNNSRPAAAQHAIDAHSPALNRDVARTRQLIAIRASHPPNTHTHTARATSCPMSTCRRASHPGPQLEDSSSPRIKSSCNKRPDPGRGRCAILLGAASDLCEGGPGSIGRPGCSSVRSRRPSLDNHVRKPRMASSSCLADGPNQRKWLRASLMKSSALGTSRVSWAECSNGTEPSEREAITRVGC